MFDFGCFFISDFGISISDLLNAEVGRSITEVMQMRKSEYAEVIECGSSWKMDCGIFFFNSDFGISHSEIHDSQNK